MNHKIIFLSYGWVVGMEKRFKRQGMEDLFELLSDVMHYVVLDDGRLTKIRRMRCQYTKLEYYIANINLIII